MLFIGTASTMQIMAEALGLALPGSALMPAAAGSSGICKRGRKTGGEIGADREYASK